MFITQHMVGPTPRVRPEAPLNVMVLSECEAVLELSESADLESHIISLAVVEWWVGQKVVTESRAATHEEVSEAKRKQGDGKKDNNNNPSRKKKRSDTCYGCGGTGHFIKDCPNPQESSLNSKRGGKKPKTPPRYNQEGDRNIQPSRGYFSRRGTDPRGWARTGLEPVAPIYLNFVPFDALLDVGSSISMIDMKVCEKLGLPINPFSCDISHCVGVEGALLTRSLICIMG